ncbi:hypothetical protein FB451DRAFT_1368722 [Mycena latifolia]|nr:hypothetical protein FB451DRAFT_1368722 [Mycena latifolia]
MPSTALARLPPALPTPTTSTMLALLRLVPSAAKASSTPARGRSSGTVRPLVLLELYRLTITDGTRRFPADVAAAPLLWRGGEGGGARGVYARRRASPSPIPMLSRCEVHASIGTWDDKWIWVISRFVRFHFLPIPKIAR